MVLYTVCESLETGIMADSAVLSVRVSKATKKRLAQIAETMQRSQSYVAAEAIEEYLAIQEWQIAGVKQALASLERGEGVSHEDVKRWTDSLGTEDEIPKPKTR